MLDNIVDNIPVAIQLKTVHDDVRIVRWNKAAEKMIGLSAERMLGRVAQELWSAEDIVRFREADRLAVASNGQEIPNRAVSTAHRGTINSHVRKVPLLGPDGVAMHLLVIMDDITERVAAEARLADCEACFRGAAESALDAFLILDAVRDGAGEICDFRFRYLNANAERMPAAPGGLAVGRLLCEMYPTRRTDGRLRSYANVVKTGTALDEEFSAVLDGVGTVWLHHQIVRLGDGIAVTARDISARKAAEEELRSNRGFLQSLIDNLTAAISVKDVRPEHFGKMVVWNKGAEAIGGIPEEEALGRRDKDIFAPDVYRAIEAHDRELLASPVVSEIAEHPCRRPDGSFVFMHTISAPLFGSDGRPEFMLRISEDVTLRCRQRKELAAKTAELLAVSDASPLGMFRTDAEGRQTYVNRTHEILTGLSAQDALASGWVSAVHPADRERVLRQWGEAIRGHKKFESLHRDQHRDGRIVWASVKAAPVVVDGNVVGVVGSVDGHTACREAEHALQTNERRLRTITDAMPARIAYVDRREVDKFVNVAHAHVFGLARENVPGRTIREVVGEAAYEKAKPYLNRAFSGETVRFEREQLLADAVRWVEATYIPELDEEGGELVGSCAMLQDITQEILEEQRLVRLSQIDSLTGLANRTGFEQRLADAMAASQRPRNWWRTPMRCFAQQKNAVATTFASPRGRIGPIQLKSRLPERLPASVRAGARASQVAPRAGEFQPETGRSTIAAIPGILPLLRPDYFAGRNASCNASARNPCVPCRSVAKRYSAAA